MDTPSAPPSVSQAEAARICGVSTATIRRRRAELVEHGAKSDGDGGWTIPIPALVAAGLLDRTTPPDTPTTWGMSPDTTPRRVTSSTPPDTSSGEVEDLRRRLRETEHRAVLAEAISEERLRALEDARTALRLIEARPHGAPVPSQPEPLGPVTATTSESDRHPVPSRRTMKQWWEERRRR